MSGQYIPNIQIPQAVPIDVAGAMQRGQGMRMNALALLAQQRQLEQQTQQQNALAMYAGGLASDDPTKRMNTLSSLVQAAPGLTQQFLPMIRDERGAREFAAVMGGGQPVAAPSATPAVQQEPLAAIARAESGGNDAARNPNSSAAGRFQITDGTWRQYAPGLGLTDAQRMDPAAQQRVAQAIQADGGRALGRRLQGWEQYGAHLLGVGGMRAFANADPNANAQEVYAQAAGPQVAAAAFRQNPGLLEPGMTVGQVQQAIAQRAGGGGAGSTSSPGVAGLPSPERLQAIAQLAASGNERAQRYLQVIGPMLNRDIRTERIRLANGDELVVPAASAAGMVSRAPPRDTQFVDLGDDAPQGAGRYEVRPDGSRVRVSGTPRPPQPDQTFTQANALRDEYTRLTTDFRTIQQAYTQIQGAARSQSGQGDMTLLYQFVRMLDPTSVVRESEFATAARTGSLPEQVQGWATRILSGERLPEDVRQGFLREARNLLDAQQRTYDRNVRNFGALAERFNLPREAVVVPFDDEELRRQQAPAAAPPAPAPAQGGGVQATPPPPATPPRVLRFDRNGRPLP